MADFGLSCGLAIAFLAGNVLGAFVWSEWRAVG